MSCLCCFVQEWVCFWRFGNTMSQGFEQTPATTTNLRLAGAPTCFNEDAMTRGSVAANTDPSVRAWLIRCC